MEIQKQMTEDGVGREEREGKTYVKIVKIMIKG